MFQRRWTTGAMSHCRCALLQHSRRGVTRQQRETGTKRGTRGNASRATASYTCAPRFCSGRGGRQAGQGEGQRTLSTKGSRNRRASEGVSFVSGLMVLMTIMCRTCRGSPFVRWCQQSSPAGGVDDNLFVQKALTTATAAADGAHHLLMVFTRNCVSVVALFTSCPSTPAT